MKKEKILAFILAHLYDNSLLIVDPYGYWADVKGIHESETRICGVDYAATEEQIQMLLFAVRKEVDYRLANLDKQDSPAPWTLIVGSSAPIFRDEKTTECFLYIEKNARAVGIDIIEYFHETSGLRSALAKPYHLDSDD